MRPVGAVLFRGECHLYTKMAIHDLRSDLTSAEPHCEKTLDEITDGKVRLQVQREHPFLSGREGWIQFEESFYLVDAPENLPLT